ncbi:trifunctional nucleotide phosphoesterase [Acrasis kona]|uniref:Trifunctional nucleotide phosphoesterase n=1 Tax=Acrasis kona TaxID=1008807 RepID=A0AAW2YXZ5_9EUKA
MIKSSSKGHFARLKYLIDRIQSIAPTQTLTIDSGDSFGGSLFHLLSASNAYSCDAVPPPEWKFLSDCHFDATVFGNHDFDGFDVGLGKRLDCAKNTTTVQVLSSNILINSDESECRKIKSSITKPDTHYSAPGEQNRPTRIVPYVLKELTDPSTNQSLKVAIFGFFGPDSSLLCNPYRKCTHFVGFNDATHSIEWAEYVQHVYDTITTVRKVHEPQVIITVAHSGVPEDEQLITSLHQLTKDDNFVHVHLGSHTHHAYSKQTKGTTLYQSDSYGTHLGTPQFQYDYNKNTVTLLNKDVRKQVYPDAISPGVTLPTHLVIDGSIPLDPHYDTLVQSYKKMIDSTFLKKSDFKYDTPIGHVDTRKLFVDIVTDCLYTQIKNLFIKDLGVYLMSEAAIRNDPEHLQKTNSTQIYFQFSDVYRVLGIGELSTLISEERKPGDVIAHFYMSRHELTMLVQGNEFAELANPTYGICFSSSLQYKTNWYGIPFLNRMVDFRINDRIMQKDDLIHVAMPAWMVKYFKKMSQMSFGILSCNFRDRFGRVIQEPDRLLVHDYELFAMCIRDGVLFK